MRGIDVAKWQGNIDWAKVKKSGCEFAILKAIDKSGFKESAFDVNYAGCIKNNIPIGVYNYSYATTVSKAKQDAEKVLSVIKGKSIPFKVWIDVEDKVQQGLGQLLTDIIKAYGNVIKSAGFEFGVYTGLSFYNSYIKKYSEQLDYPFWIARYPTTATRYLNSDLPEDKKPVIKNTLWAWQYSSSGSVSGISTKTDLNICYDTAKEEIKKEVKEETGNAAIKVVQAWCGANQDGFYGKDTKALIVKKLQPYLGMAKTGIVDDKLLSKIKTLRRGDKGEIVKCLEALLFCKGYNPQDFKGDFNEKVAECVEKFQTDKKLKADRLAGKLTWTELLK